MWNSPSSSPVSQPLSDESTAFAGGVTAPSFAITVTVAVAATPVPAITPLASKVPAWAYDAGSFGAHSTARVSPTPLTSVTCTSAGSCGAVPAMVSAVTGASPVLGI